MTTALNLQEWFGGIDIYLFDQLLKGRIAPGMTVLDAGCGAGRNLVYLLRSGFEVCGVDESSEAIAQVRRMAEEQEAGGRSRRQGEQESDAGFRGEDAVMGGKHAGCVRSQGGRSRRQGEEEESRRQKAESRGQGEQESDAGFRGEDAVMGGKHAGCVRSQGNFRVEAVERMSWEDESFEVVLSSAVLHFARSEEQWQAMMNEMWRVLKPGGIFFARLASSIGIEGQVKLIAGRRYRLPDGSDRFLVDEAMLLGVMAALGGEFLDPIKTTIVQNMRAMTTICLKKRGRGAGQNHLR